VAGGTDAQFALCGFFELANGNASHTAMIALLSMIAQLGQRYEVRGLRSKVRA
jgi:hypothetical protein